MSSDAEPPALFVFAGPNGSGKIIRRRFPWHRHIFADGGSAGPELRGALDKLGHWTLEIVTPDFNSACGLSE